MQFNTQEQNKPIFDSTGWLPITGDDILKQQGRKVPPPLVNCSDISQSWQQICQKDSWRQQEDYHQNQESRTVTSTIPHTQSLKQVTQGYPEKNYNELQHILASNIRNLLLGEEDSKSAHDSVTLQRLQKNIDEWTALEYSKRNKTKYNADTKKGLTATTLADISHQHFLIPSKKIPEEYLTTTPLTYDDGPQTENHIATAIPSFNKIKNTPLSSTKSNSFATLSPFQDFEAAASHSHTVRTVTSTSFETNIRKAKDNHKSEIVPSNHQSKSDNNRWNFIESNFIIPEAKTTITEALTEVTNFTYYPTTTATPDTTIPTTTTEAVTDIYSNMGHTTWDQIPLSISPITNEKVYVVTPVTTWRPEPTKSTSINDVFPFRNGPPTPQKLIASPQFSFKSPRFIVRPTPGTTIQRMFTVNSNEEEDSLNSIKRTREPIKSNKIDGYKKVEHNSTIEDTLTTQSPSREDLLLGNPTLPTYTPPNGSRVLTDSGHSKVVTVASSATPTTPIRMKETKKQSTVATTKLFPVTTSRPQPRGGFSRKLRPDRDSYVWQFPELSVQPLQKDVAEAVKETVVELKKEDFSS
ncbi:hypothetical protein L9F63_018914 [Diploptera punctata]|uniref:Uncharacterized protein n=1 Tax=Diploptera punctata TaxID=6984 RepID=A0AAD7ZVW1_DIPPU|nr:hypothetical protein L9F63_018914 [Diploptera punctata]